MADYNQRKSAKEFSEFWQGKGYEKGQSQAFWMSLLRDVFGIEHPESFISFEDQVHLDHTSFIDGYIPSTRVMIEQKSLGKNLNQAIKQSDGTLLTPFQQAKRYIAELPVSKHPRFVVTCNFEEFFVYDMEQPKGEPEVIKLQDLEKEYYRLSFLTKTENVHLKKEMEVSIKAGEIVGVIYDALLKQYYNTENEETLKSLNILCVRLVFCLYAEDAEIFGRNNMFLDYMKQFEAKHFRKALIELFRVLDTKVEERDPYIEPDLAAFPYVNGGLFANENIEIPNFTDEIRDLILEKASANFDWSEISPTIFGAVFESTLNPDTRRKGGMHYTSIENIHKVIDPLFMDDLNAEFKEICNIKVDKAKDTKLKAFQEKIANLTFLDPACGSGNFLTETYISLRKLENKILFELQKGQIKIGAVTNPIQVSIRQFYGIEINDFAVTVAKTALWIAESQMMKQTEDIVHMNLDFLPLKTYANIVEANALRIDWETVVPKEKLNYIMGNPPFVGYSLQSKSQKDDILSIYVDEKGKPYKTAGKIDYVACWYYKASKMMQGTNIKTALVSTNSITQGEQVAAVWKPLCEQFGIHIDFAHKTFRWDSEASLKAHVHCVIVGFSCFDDKRKRKLYSNDRVQLVDNINFYLVDANNIFVESCSKPICNVPKMTTGNRPADGGHLIIEAEDYDEFIKKEPNAKKYIKKLTGAMEFINNKARYCLWLVDINPKELRNMPEVLKRVEACKEDRLNGAEDRQKLAATPWLFRETKCPDLYVIVPATSSENRKYVPMGFLDSSTIATNSATIIPNANLYDFGILTSNVHMAWMRTVCGRLEMRYRYSKDIVYNNFPWCNSTDEQKAKIEKTAQGILDARELYPECSLADLYDDLTMPKELRKAHQENDKAVMEAYGFCKKDENGKRTWLTESETVAKLMEMYQKRTLNMNKH
ncbi:TPA: class I SAM-dependent DNA methyltransferase [Candidatus Gastranaerophilales bacterium HUM_6]|nr:putative uncharacterized protein [Fusobacterium sp. CAG:815]DAA89820.1 MAG TPA: class I SAM-dependent DNA methyltransferase [Candidatus Gastranaerophilales bacterium HUM_6]DAA91513.1 MAG TPA: class I SAM-dependent DNA methyltransferase [Candidatus Gastranaerophilales bacterium HUM_7]DAB00148.1 MAG TPA: class I SAM-dependent DNA methyltransferase [Candidatus Gastranaerophilales bacterium HUM_12]DAB06660.1 MAG TPA: class I SAM-dependent DNA methyltransferase [Candidatus Gastranaerophilales bac